MNHKAEYDALNNIQFFEFIGTPKTIEDVEFIINKNYEACENRDHKVWVVTDITNLSSTSPSIISEFARLNEQFVGKHVIDDCAFCAKGLQRIMTKVYNNLVGKKNKPVFKTKEEATSWILERQKTEGVIKSLT